MHDVAPATHAAAKRMRREPTHHERLAWRVLRNRRLAGLKFRRQVPIGRYIVDFVCFSQRLIVEFDGPVHDPEADARRDDWLRSQNFRVLRFSNSRLALEPDVVLDEICLAAGSRR